MSLNVQNSGSRLPKSSSERNSGSRTEWTSASCKRNGSVTKTLSTESLQCRPKADKTVGITATERKTLLQAIITQTVQNCLKLGGGSSTSRYRAGWVILTYLLSKTTNIIG